MWTCLDWLALFQTYSCFFLSLLYSLMMMIKYNFNLLSEKGEWKRKVSCSCSWPTLFCSPYEAIILVNCINHQATPFCVCRRNKNIYRGLMRLFKCKFNFHSTYEFTFQSCPSNWIYKKGFLCLKLNLTLKNCLLWKFKQKLA